MTDAPIMADRPAGSFPLEEAGAIAERLGRAWRVVEHFGPSGWVMQHERARARVIVSEGLGVVDGRVWLHASIANDRRMPDYEELQLLHRAVWPLGYAYQYFVPPTTHVNIHATALHLWGLKSGEPLLPDWGAAGSI